MGAPSTRILWVILVVCAVVMLALGIIIGHFAIKKSKCQQDESSSSRSYKTREQRDKTSSTLLGLMDAEQLEKNLKYFSAKPHIAGSKRQKEMAEELAERWRKYNFDKVEMPEYKVLLSFPQKDNPNTVTLFQGNTVIHKIAGKEQIAEPSENDPDVIPPYLGYAPNGTVKRKEMVYANYGRVEDFQKLVDLSVNVTDKIVIMRYGKIYRGDKVANAANYGAVGALLYSDPADYALKGMGPEDVYPKTAWLPGSGAQRGSVGKWPGNGDPLTPGLPSVDGMYRRPASKEFLPPIPAHPMGYNDAVHFLRNLGGNEVPSGWNGTLNITYRLGPKFVGNDMAIELVINNKLETKSIYNVIGTIYGKEEPDRYVLMGNHRDSWVFGAVDASSGTSTTTEVARGLGVLLKEGWKPRRTIKICSWAAEEFALIGSVEWVEQHMKVLSERAVAYLNFDVSVGGNFAMQSSSSPLMKDNIWDSIKKIDDPNAHDGKNSIYDIMKERNPSKYDSEKPKIGTLGSGSDYASFYQYVGVPSADFSYSFGHANKMWFYPIYHSQHDTFNWMKTFVDPEFKFHRAMAQLSGVLLLHYADTPLLSMSMSNYAEILKKALATLKDDKNLKGRGGISLKVLENAIGNFSAAAKTFNDVRSKVAGRLENDKDWPSFSELRMLNDQMIRLERAFIYPYGLPGRRLIRHVVFAPSKYNAYGSSSFPGITDVLFNIEKTGDWEEVKRQISIAAQAVLSASDVIAPHGKQ